MLLTNGRIYTMDAAGSVIDALIGEVVYGSDGPRIREPRTGNTAS